MSRDLDQDLGQLLDEALGEKLGLYYQPAWHPKYRAARRRSRVKRIALASVGVAAAGMLALPLTVRLPEGHGAVSNLNLSSVHLPSGLSHNVSQISHGAFSVSSMMPVYGTYPVANPTGHDLTLTGSFSINGSRGDTLSLLLNNKMKLMGGMLFNQGTPTYSFTGSSMEDGTAVASPSPATPIQGEWLQQDNVGINTASVAGNHTYVTHNNLWADITGSQLQDWVTSPANPRPNTVDSIAALPSSPDQALLTEEKPSGLSDGFITHNGGRTWVGWGLGAQTVSNLIAMKDRFWAILNGTLAWSANGRQWNSVLNLNIKKWQVESFALDPANPNVMAVALIPISGDGVGPVLESQNGGQSWQEVPHFPAIGAAPTTMVMTANGDIAALINANGPTIVYYAQSTGQWSIVPVPATSNAEGLGQLAASPNGDLLYGAPGGSIYQWVGQSKVWLVINPPPGLDGSGQAPSPLGSIGNQQITASYPSGWWIVYEPPHQFAAAVKTALKAKSGTKALLARPATLQTKP
ncbi:hypothetical protein [Sulfobacillus harzensis]|uniref:Uncharacterized protein n=1 Tax=Sulfobacillus harzensis TaxID=2729629 RepID=A0A7Y0L058_9FIRM|nr:hypothetical protein [Sulfobacillus harzensis]NMP20843.1 hypothetical protein [Sulfobacillus harzensis]